MVKLCTVDVLVLHEKLEAEWTDGNRISRLEMHGKLTLSNDF